MYMFLKPHSMFLRRNSLHNKVRKAIPSHFYTIAVLNFGCIINWQSKVDHEGGERYCLPLLLNGDSCCWKLDETCSESESCTVGRQFSKGVKCYTDKITEQPRHMYRWPIAELSLELTFQGMIVESSVQMTDLIQKSREGLKKNHKDYIRIFRQWSISTNF